MDKINAKGLECPKPVILIKNALKEEDSASIIVDNEVARDNIKRFGENNGYRVVVIENDEGIELQLKKEDVNNDKSSSKEEVVVLIKSDEFGTGDSKLGSLLMKSFLVSLLESDRKVKSLIFMNSGVFLTTKNEEIIEVIKSFSDRGTAVFSCGTCLDFYSLKSELRVGEITNMYSSVDALLEKGNKVIIL